MEKGKEKFDIIIQGGQSNADGEGRGFVEKEFNPSSKIKYLNSFKTINLLENYLEIIYEDKPFEISVANNHLNNGELCGDFSLSFAEAYVKQGYLEKGRSLLIIRAAVGGTGFFGKHWGLNDSVYLKMLDMVDYALSLNRENRVVAFLWHQGEHDAVGRHDPKVYQEQLDSMIKAVRSRYGCMPFVVGDFVCEWKKTNKQLCEPILSVIHSVIEQNKKCGFVNTQGLLSNNQKLGNGDIIHFCRQSLQELGCRYFASFCKCLEK